MREEGGSLPRGLLRRLPTPVCPPQPGSAEAAGNAQVTLRRGPQPPPCETRAEPGLCIVVRWQASRRGGSLTAAPFESFKVTFPYVKYLEP